MPKYFDKYTGREIEYGDGFITSDQLKEAVTTTRIQGNLGVQKDIEFNLPQEPKIKFAERLDSGWLIFTLGVIILLAIVFGFVFY